MGGERESGLEARFSSSSREYEIRGVPPGVVPYTEHVALADVVQDEAGVLIAIVDDMVLRQRRG